MNNSLTLAKQLEEWFTIFAEECSVSVHGGWVSYEEIDDKFKSENKEIDGILYNYLSTEDNVKMMDKIDDILLFLHDFRLFKRKRGERYTSNLRLTKVVSEFSLSNTGAWLFRQKSRKKREIVIVTMILANKIIQFLKEYRWILAITAGGSQL